MQEPETEMRNRNSLCNKPQNTKIAGKSDLHKKQKQSQTNTKQTQTKQTKNEQTKNNT